MGFSKTVNRDMRYLGRKSSEVIHVIGQKSPTILSAVSKDLMVAAKVGEAVSGGLTLFGQPELAAPVLAGAEALRLGSIGAKGASKSITQLNNKNYVGAVATGVQTGMTIKKENKKNIEKQQKTQTRLK